MSLVTTLSTALKEWAVVCDALGAGTQLVLLRKGGILEAIGGFEVENPRFLLFPTYLHQQPDMLKPPYRGGISPRESEPAAVVLSVAAEVTDVVRVASRGQVDAIDAEHVWAPPLIDMRFNYRPKNPLYLLILRAYRLRTPVTIPNAPAYAGCKSWVPLERPIGMGDATPVLDDGAFERRRAGIMDAVAAVP